MFWHNPTPSRPAARTPALGAREIAHFDGVIANDNDAEGGPPRRSGFELPTVAFFSGLGAAGLVVMAERLLGL
jgi:hypothetical protein